jgi:hypothetical protein
MGINIRFEGICTQVRLKTAIGKVYHRAVLVHGEHKHKIKKHKVPPHHAFLQIDQLDIKDVSEEIRGETLRCLITQPDGNWQLTHARLFVENAVDGKPEYDSSADFYSLKELTPDFGELSQPVVYGNDAACHFDVGSGFFEGEQTPRGSRFTRLRIETAGAPILRIEDMKSGGSGTIELQEDATIVVKNTGGKRGESKHDFLLHYLTAATMPSDPKVPEDNSPPGNEGLGPGCSNSMYP